MLDFDIDEKVSSKDDDFPDAYMKRFKQGLLAIGINEEVVIQTACGEVGQQYKISYHITVPQVKLSLLFKLIKEESNKYNVNKLSKPMFYVFVSNY